MTLPTLRLGLDLGYWAGWLPVFFSPGHAGKQLESLRAGLAKSGRTPEGFDIAPIVPLVTGTDWTACARRVRGVRGPCTSAAWAGARTTTTRGWPHAWASVPKRPSSRRSSSPETIRGRRRPYRSNSSTRPRCSDR